MAVPIEMPRPGNTVEECLLSRWHKRPGDPVRAGEVIAEIETDKASFEVAAPAAGTLLGTFLQEGQLAPVYSTIAVLGEPGEDIEPFRPRAAATAAARQDRARPEPQPPAGGVAIPPPEPTGRAALSPRARRFAAEHDFHPPIEGGSGPGGRVLEDDLRRLYHSSPRVSPLARQKLAEGFELPAQAAGTILARDLLEPAARLSPVRERIARRMRESLSATAQYTLHASAGAAGLLGLRGRFKKAHQETGAPDVNINDLVMFCAAQALKLAPELNVEFSGGRLRRHAAIHLGFACDTPRGLLVPVVRHCEGLAPRQLAERVRELSRQAFEGAISPDDLAGATFTISNLGAYGIESFTPILNPPQVAILGVNAIQVRPVRKDGRVEFEDRIGLSLTLDHQVIDGAPGARFLQVLRERIETVESLCTI